MVERKNRSIVGVTITMLHDQTLHFFLWAEECSTNIYLQKKRPHCALWSNTHEDMLTRKKHEVGHFHIFGFLIFSHVPSENRTNIEPTVERGIFVGYDETSKAFCIYIPTLRKVVVIWGVIFEEEQAFGKAIVLVQEEQQVHTP